jgi:H+/Cl- antiporter ClcA
MQYKEKTTLRKITQSRSEGIFLILRGIEVGVAAGLVCVAYRYALEIAEKGLNSVLEAVNGNPLRIAGWLALLAVIGIIVSFIIKWEPDAGGSGIPQTSGEIRGYFSLNWWKVIIAKFIGGATSVFAGLSLGREGPSVQLGGMAAKGCAVLTRADKTSQTRMVACGAGAGMSAAFNAPIAGAMFVFEEIHHSIDKSLLCMGIVATIVADFVSKLFFGQDPIFRYDAEALPLKYYWIIIIMGLVSGVAGVSYNVIMVKAQALFKKLSKIPNPVKLAFVFVVSGVVGLLMPQILCGGHRMAELLINDRPELKMIIILLFAKFLFGVFSFASGAPGGTLYPLCILGAYIGAVFGEIATGSLGMDESLRQEFIILGMAGLFASIVRAPLTGIILVFELTGNMQNLLPVAVVSLISYALANLIGTAPFYAILFEKTVNGVEAPKLNSKAAEKVLETFVIPIGSQLDGKKISDIDWGKHCLIVSVERNDVPITPKGDTELKAGDMIVMMISQRHFSQDLNRVYDIINN